MDDTVFGIAVSPDGKWLYAAIQVEELPKKQTVSRRIECVAAGAGLLLVGCGGQVYVYEHP